MGELKEGSGRNPKDDSEARINALNQAVFETVDRVAEQMDGDFTLCELTHVFLRIIFTYNKKALDQQQIHGLELREDPSDFEVNQEEA